MIVAVELFFVIIGGLYILAKIFEGKNNQSYPDLWSEPRDRWEREVCALYHERVPGNPLSIIKRNEVYEETIKELHVSSKSDVSIYSKVFWENLKNRVESIAPCDDRLSAMMDYFDKRISLTEEQFNELDYLHSHYEYMGFPRKRIEYIKSEIWEQQCYIERAVDIVLASRGIVSVHIEGYSDDYIRFPKQNPEKMVAYDTLKKVGVDTSWICLPEKQRYLRFNTILRDEFYNEKSKKYSPSAYESVVRPWFEEYGYFKYGDYEDKSKDTTGFWENKDWEVLFPKEESALAKSVKGFVQTVKSFVLKKSRDG